MILSHDAACCIPAFARPRGEPSPPDPVLVVDSGLGGLTVAAALRRVLPAEKLLYFGDTARMPYGSKSAASVARFVTQIVASLAVHRPKHLVVACNSASAAALPTLRQRFPWLSISGVIDPGARAAAGAAGRVLRPVIAVIATDATVRSRAYDTAIARRRSRARLILQATPLLAPIVEEGRDCDDPLVDLALRQYLDPVRASRPDVLLLGCTHYPLLRPAIERIMGRRTKVIDSARTAAEDVGVRLASAGLLRPPAVDAADTSDPTPPIRLFASDDSPRFARLATRFLGEDPGEPTVITPEELTEAGADAASFDLAGGRSVA